MLQDARLPPRNAGLWLTALACSVNLVFGTLLLANSLGISYYHFYALKVVNIVIISPFWDWLIWVISAVIVVAELIWLALRGHQNDRIPLWVVVPAVLLMASLVIFPFNSQVAAIVSAPVGFAVVALTVYYGKGLLFDRRRDAIALVFGGGCALLIVFEVASLGSWVTNAFNYEFPFSDSPRWIFPTVDLNLFSLLYPLIPWLLLVFLSYWIWMPLLKWLLVRWGKWKPAFTEVPPPLEMSRRLQAAVLLISAALAGFVAYYPYIRLPSQYLLGIDGIRYFNFLTRMINEGPIASIAPDRPLFMLLLYYVQATTQQPVEIIVRTMPVVCAVSLVLAAFWLVRTGTKDVRLALLSSILTAFSFQITAGMMGYFLAGWFSLALIMVFFTLLLKAMERRPILYASLAGLISIVVLGIHPYNWLVMAAILVAYILLTVIVRRGIRREALVSAVPLAITAVAAIPLILFTNLGANGVPTVIGILNSLWNTLVANLNPSKLTLLLPSLSNMANRWVGGAFGSPLIYILGIIGAVFLVDLKKNFNRLLLCWVLVPSLAIFALVPGMEPLFYRIAYLIPFQIFAAVGLYWLIWRLGKALAPPGTNPERTRYVHLLQIMLLFLLVLFLFNYALRIVDQAVVLSI